MIEPFDLKTWSDYTHEEKTELLKHWFFRFGRQLLALEDYETFLENVDRNPDGIWLVAIVTTLCKRDATLLANALQKGEVDAIITAATVFLALSDDDQMREFERVEQELLLRVILSYNAQLLAGPTQTEISDGVIDLEEYRGKKF